MEGYPPYPPTYYAGSTREVLAQKAQASYTWAELLMKHPLFILLSRGILMADHHTTLADLRAQIEAFVAERDWSQFHSPKNLSMAIAIEAAELMEHFQWLTIEELRQMIGEG